MSIITAKNNRKPRILILAGNLNRSVKILNRIILDTKISPPALDAEIVGIVTYGEACFMRQIAVEFNLPYQAWQGPFSREDYDRLLSEYNADFVVVYCWDGEIVNLADGRFINLSLDWKESNNYSSIKMVINKLQPGEVGQIPITICFEGGGSGDEAIIHQAFLPVELTDGLGEVIDGLVRLELVLLSRILNKVVNGYIFLHKGKACFRDDNPKDIYRL